MALTLLSFGFAGGGNVAFLAAVVAYHVSKAAVLCVVVGSATSVALLWVGRVRVVDRAECLAQND